MNDAATPHLVLNAEPALVGRRAEWKRIVKAFDQAAAGIPCALLLEGATGIGKTTLLEAASAAAEGRRTRGAASASAWAALDQRRAQSSTPSPSRARIK